MEQPTSQFDKAVATGKKFQEVAGIVTSIVAVGSAIAAYIADVGGVAGFLKEVVWYALGAFISWIALLPPVFLLHEKIEKETNRSSNDVVMLLLFAAPVMGGAYILRNYVFYIEEDVGEGSKVFTSILGALILLLPIGLFWYFKGSQPNKP